MLKFDDLSRWKLLERANWDDNAKCCWKVMCSGNLNWHSYQRINQYNAIKWQTHIKSFPFCRLKGVPSQTMHVQVACTLFPREQCVYVCVIILLSGCNTQLLPTVSLPLGSDDSDCTPGTLVWRVGECVSVCEWVRERVCARVCICMLCGIHLGVFVWVHFCLQDNWEPNALLQSHTWICHMLYEASLT